MTGTEVTKRPLPGNKRHKVIDWETVEKEFRANQFSIREIGLRHNVAHVTILRKAKRLKWKRDLVEKVRSLVANKLLGTTNTDGTTSDGTQEVEIIEKAADNAVAVVTTHRKDAYQQQVVVRQLMGMLDERINGPVKPDMEGLRAAASISRDCAMAFSKLVTIERQAYNLDDSGVRPESQTVVFNQMNVKNLMAAIQKDQER